MDRAIVMLLLCIIVGFLGVLVADGQLSQIKYNDCMVDNAERITDLEAYCKALVRQGE